MLTLKIHTVDNHSLNSATVHGLNPININELRGVAHLFGHLPPSSSSSSPLTFSLSSPSFRSTLLFVVAVPNYISADEFLTFCGSHVNFFSELIFLRNDGMEDRYIVLIRLVDQLSSDGFYSYYNGKRFQPTEVCRLCQQQDEKPNCALCGTLEIPCVCLICGFVGCGRYEKGHAIMHWSETQHGYSLELGK